MLFHRCGFQKTTMLSECDNNCPNAFWSMVSAWRESSVISMEAEQLQSNAISAWFGMRISVCRRILSLKEDTAAGFKIVLTLFSFAIRTAFLQLQLQFQSVTEVSTVFKQMAVTSNRLGCQSSVCTSQECNHRFTIILNLDICLAGLTDLSLWIPELSIPCSARQE